MRKKIYFKDCLNNYLVLSVDDKVINNNINIKRYKFLEKEINRIIDILLSEFTEKAPINVFLKMCEKLYDYEMEIEKIQTNFVAEIKISPEYFLN